MVKSIIQKTLLIFIITLVTVISVQTSTNARTLKWETMPIKVCVPNNKYAPLMKKAFFEWSTVTQDKVRFLYTCQDPQITISYSPNKQKSITTYSFDSNGHIFKSHIDMGLKTKQGNQTPDDLLVLLMEHEIAHALGIEGHVNTPQSIMRPTVEKGFTITSDTLAEIKKRYK